MKILITGGTGFVGTALVKFLAEQGHQITLLTREKHHGAQVPEIVYPNKGALLDSKQLSEFQAIINLAGASISSVRWTKAGKNKILNSRITVTKLLVESMKKNQELQMPYPQIFISTSAVGYYGLSENEIFDEAGRNGAGFLADVARQWEEEAKKAKNLSTRNIILRFGIVLGDGGILKQLKKPFEFGVGGYIASGKQWISWIALEDLIRIISYMLMNQNASGIYNACAPDAVSMKELTLELAKALHKKAWTKTPGWVLHLLMGQMAEELIIHGQRATPNRLQKEGFSFSYENISKAMDDIFRT